MLEAPGAEAPEGENPFANRTLPHTARSRAGLEAYSGPWDFGAASHLLRRALFGPQRSEIAEALRKGLGGTLDLLFAPQPLPAPPLNYGVADTAVPEGQTWVEAPSSANSANYRRRSLLDWSIGQLIGQGISLREKMTLFWHNHFAIEFDVVREPKYMYQYITLLRTNALGNFRQLAQDITVNPAMLQYLNGNQNTDDAPNENYARELFELFTIGKGPLIAPGDYTYYTEADVQAAARVLTGWRDRMLRNAAGAPYAEFVAASHDNSAKQFSAAFGNQVIQPGGAEEYKALVNMVFQQKETARHICRKLYRWFVYYVIDEAAEESVIEPMAQVLLDNDFDIAPALRALLGSAHFFDAVNRGCLIKNPIDFVVGILRQHGVALPGPDQLMAQYNIWDFFSNSTGSLQMMYFYPPSVAGWQAYYQEPVFHEIWINSATLPGRNQFSDLLTTTGYRRNGQMILINPLPMVEQVSDPMDPNVVVSELAALLLPQPLTASQLDFLKETLLPGLPDYEWTLEYGDYLADPDNRDKRTAVSIKLLALVKTIMNLAEFQLS